MAQRQFYRKVVKSEPLLIVRKHVPSYPRLPRHIVPMQFGMQVYDDASEAGPQLPQRFKRRYRLFSGLARQTLPAIPTVRPHGRQKGPQE